MTFVRSSTLPRTAPATERKPAKGPRTVKCRAKGCMHRVVPDLDRPQVTWCSIDCGAAIALAAGAARKAKLQRAERAADKVKKLAIEPLEYWLKRAEKACNTYVRKRDEGHGCISCGRHDAEVWNAGHFISVGANRTLRFNEDNIHLQCARPCNKDKGGNIHEYRKELIKKIGQARVDVLDGWHAPVKMTVAAAQEIEAKYKAKLKALTGDRE